MENIQEKTVEMVKERLETIQSLIDQFKNNEIDFEYLIDRVEFEGYQFFTIGEFFNELKEED